MYGHRHCQCYYHHRQRVYGRLIALILFVASVAVCAGIGFVMSMFSGVGQ